MIKKISFIGFLPFFVAFLDYDYFPVSAILFIFLIKFKIFEIYFKKIYLLIFVNFFYIIRFISSIYPNMNNFWISASQKNYSLNGKFIDIQGVFWNLNCNSLNASEYTLFGTEQTLLCPYSVSYGPFFKFIAYENNVLLNSYVFSFFSILLILIYFNLLIFKAQSANFYFIALISISPPINFLIERMNLDIFIFISIFVCYKCIKNDNIRNLFLFFLALLKYYPIIFIFGSLIFKMLNKNKALFSEILLLFLFTFIYLYENILNENPYPPVQPFRVDRTFGILSQSIAFERIFNVNKNVAYIALILFIATLFFLLRKMFDYSEVISDQFTHDVVFTFIIISLIANYDYRIPLLFLILNTLLESKNCNLVILFILFVFSSPSPLHSYEKYFYMVEDNLFIYLDFTFYFFLVYLLLEYSLYFRSKRNTL